MSINAIEDGAEVITPDGFRGWVRVTRRERMLIEAGRLADVDVLLPHGRRTFRLSELTVVRLDESDTGNTFDQWFDLQGYEEEHRAVFRAVWEAARHDL